MRVTGITAEYNPFHNGHRYHIEKTRKLTEADHILSVMSGSFTQRGEPAIMDKWTRAKLAVMNGVDIVFELPFIFACSPAPSFAAGSIDILVKSGVTHISFGSENGDIKTLKEAAAEIVLLEDRISEKRAEIMKEGYSYARANQMAVEFVSGSDVSGLMSSPNNILALEYLKRIRLWEEMGRHVEPVTVKRCGSGYFDADDDAGFAGASVIRDKILHEEDISIYVPENTGADICSSKEQIPSSELMFQLIRAEIIRKTPEQLAQIYCVGEGLEYKLKKEAVTCRNLQDFISSMVSKRYTESAVRRIMIYILLGIRKGICPEHLYGRVLAAGKGGRKLLRIMKKTESADIPLITNVNKEAHHFPEITELLEMDMLAADMYNILSDRDLYRFSDKVFRGYFG